MIVTAYFSESGSPKTGLSPTVDIIDISDNSVDVNDGAMTEVGQGFYKYTFSGYDSSKDYLVIADSVTLTGDERYAIGSIELSQTERDVLEDTNEIQGKLPTNEIMGSSTKADKDGVLDRILGLSHENIYIDNTVYDGNNNLTSARLRIYSIAGSVGSDSDVVATYTITGTASGANKFSSWQQIKA